MINNQMSSALRVGVSCLKQTQKSASKCKENIQAEQLCFYGLVVVGGACCIEIMLCYGRVVIIV